MKIKYREIRLSKANMDRLDDINVIIEEYQANGHKLTLRQLYYQLVARGIIPNKQSEYAKLSRILKEGRMGGIVDWNAIEDRLRVPSAPYFCHDVHDAISDTINTYRLNRMKGQDNYVEVWVEKDAISSVLKRVTQKFGVPIVVNRGYSSVSAMHDAYLRFYNAIENDRKNSVRVLYLGDYDPSGLDMIRDIKSRILEFSELDFCEDEFNFDIIPIALTREQIDKYSPPPNPAKMSDPRASEFVDKYGTTSWEVDALRPEVLHDIVRTAIVDSMDYSLYEDLLDKEKEDKEKLILLSKKM